MTSNEPNSLSVGLQLAIVRLGTPRRFRDKQVEGQPCQDPRGHDQQMALVVDDVGDRTEQRFVEVVRKAEAEELATLRRLLRVLEVHPSAESLDLIRQRLRPNRDALPGGTFARQSPDEGFFGVPRQQND